MLTELVNRRCALFRAPKYADNLEIPLKPVAIQLVKKRQEHLDG